MIAVSGSCFDTTIFLSYIFQKTGLKINSYMYSPSDCSVYTGLMVITVCHSLVTVYPLFPGVLSLIPARSHTFVENDHEIISTVILLPSAD